MFGYSILFRCIFYLFIALFALGISASFAQEETADEIKYREDYEALQKIGAIKTPLERANQMLNFYKSSPDADAKLMEYANVLFAQDLNSLLEQNNAIAVRGLADRALKLKPSFGEAYLFRAELLKDDGKMEEAMLAYAKCYVIRNTLQGKCKELLDAMYKARNKGSLDGLDKIVSQAREELK